MRKSVVILLLVVFIFGSVIGVQASTKTTNILTKELAVKAAKTQLEIGENYELQDASFQEQTNPYDEKDKFWSLHFSKEDDKGNISVRVDAETGKVTNFNFYEPYDESNNQAVMTWEEGKQLALAWIEKLMPERVAQVALTDDPNNRRAGSTRFEYNFQRNIDGYAFINDGFRASVDSSKRQVTSYNYQWTEGLAFPDLAVTVNKDEAVAKFKELDETRLIYMMTRDKKGQEQGLKLVYTSELPESGLLNAFDGILLPSERVYRNYLYGGATGMDLAKEEYARDQSSSAGGMIETVPDEGVISKEKATGIVQDILAPLVDFSKLELTSASFGVYNNGQKKQWRFYWGSPQDENMKEDTLVQNQNVNAALDAETGAITSISLYNHTNRVLPPQEEKDQSKGFTFSELENMASEVITKVFPDQLNQVQFVEDNYYGIPRPLLEKSEKLTTTIKAERLINEIPYPNNNMRFSFDAETNQLLNFNYQWEEVTAPDAKDILTLDEAENIYYDKAGIITQYVQLQEDNKPVKDVVLAHGVKPHTFRYIEAKSGNLLDYSGDVMEQKNLASELTDINAHWAEREIRLLFDQGVIETEDGQFKPDKKITRQEAVKMLTLVNGYIGNYDSQTFKDVPKDHPYYKYIEAAVRMELIDGNRDYFYPESELTRETFAVMLIRLAGYEKVAALSEIYVVPFKDGSSISEDKIGYVALAHGFHIFNGYQGYFQPQGHISRAETAVALYRTTGLVK